MQLSWQCLHEVPGKFSEDAPPNAAYQHSLWDNQALGFEEPFRTRESRAAKRLFVVSDILQMVDHGEPITNDYKF